MEIFMRSIAFDASQAEVIRAIAQQLHQPHFRQESGLPVNFKVFLHPNKRGVHGAKHGGTGTLTLPSEELGRKFLATFGSHFSPPISVSNRRIAFSLSNKAPRDNDLEEIRRMPYQDPIALEERLKRHNELATTLQIETLQFGWRCRDSAFSVEWEGSMRAGWEWEMTFDATKRHLCLQSLALERNPRARRNEGGPLDLTALLVSLGLDLDEQRDILSVLVRFSSISFVERDRASRLVLFTLETPPVFLQQSPNPFGDNTRTQWRRLSSLANDHAHVAPFTGLLLGVLFLSETHFDEYLRMSRVARLRKPEERPVTIVARNLFCLDVLSQLNNWLSSLPWPVAFQMEAILRNLYADPLELLALRGTITRAIRRISAEAAETVFIGFRNGLHALSSGEEETGETVASCWEAALADSVTSTPSQTHSDLFSCRHIKVTPTGFALEGPFPERSNVVFRRYQNTHHFVRVSFVEETLLQYRWERDVNGAGFVQERVGGFLHHGIDIGGRHLEFLAYSQSALKEHAVWFVIPFVDPVTSDYVNGRYIRDRLGDFKKIIRFPAKYGARISQRFTATDMSVSVNADEVIHMPDIERNGSNFTDGVGTISPELRDTICDAWEGRGLLRTGRSRPSAFQIRFGGAKGMVSVDWRLDGLVLCDRPSMIKFAAPDLSIEIARAFDAPSPLFLNRPLIALLEGLSVPANVFLDLQRKAVQEVKSAAHALDGLAEVLMQNGLGTAFRLPSVLLRLRRLGITYDAVAKDPFFCRTVTLAVNHILREMKHRARIPIPGSWTLPGIADVHDYLKEGEIYACVRLPGSAKCIYLEGCVLVTRSPVIHPGDVQFAHAIGRPPKPSPFDKEALVNTVVFSCRGSRSLPSCLGGGDLDGDVFGIITLTSLHPSLSRIYPPAAYAATDPFDLGRPSTIDDVADFVVNFINSDVVGVIATNHLIISDASNQGIFDPDCLRLAELHSQAVDYPKSGRAVNLLQIPKPKLNLKPDFLVPETREDNLGLEYYKSAKALGQLFRDIDLDDIDMKPYTPKRSRKSRKRRSRRNDQVSTNELEVGPRKKDDLGDAILKLVDGFIDVETIDEQLEDDMAALQFSYAEDLQHICTNNTLSRKPSAMLSEEEVIIGTIEAKTSQPRFRKELISRMRGYATDLVARIRGELAGTRADGPLEDWMRRAWAAWQESRKNPEVFGARSFGWIALGSIFECVRKMENAEDADDY